MSGLPFRYYPLFLARRSLNERRSITIRWWVPLPISSLPSLAATLKSTRFPSDRTVPLLPALFGKALVERTKIDHNSLVGSAADLLIAVACRHFEVNSFSLRSDRSVTTRSFWQGAR